MCIGPELITEAEYLAVIKLNTTLTAFCLILDGEKNKKKKRREIRQLCWRHCDWMQFQ